MYDIAEESTLTNGHATAEKQRALEQIGIPTFEAKPVDYSRMIHSLAVWKSILNARLLALLSLLGTLMGFGFCMFQPDPMRLWGLAIYAILCQAPILALYMRKG